MPENQYNSQLHPRSTSWIISDLQENEKPKVVRTFINSAIYVEKEITEMPPQRKTSPLNCLDEPNNDVLYKKYPCVSPENYSFNNNVCKKSVLQINNSANKKSSQEILQFTPQKTPESGYITMIQSSNASHGQSDGSSSSDTTIKACQSAPSGNANSELRLSLTYLNSNRTCTLDPKEKDEIVQTWIARKELEKKRKAVQEAKLIKQKEEERQRLIEKERENFKKWLAEKKKEEERKRMQKEFEVEQEKLRQAEKEKKKVESDINFNMWLRKKRKHDLEKKITEKLALLHMYEEKQKKIEENERAYQKWLQNSRHRQKPIPMNKGLRSLCSSTSVTYINPIPWNPNIDPNFKSASQ